MTPFPSCCSSSFAGSEEGGAASDEEPKVNEEEFFFAVAESTSKITIHAIRCEKYLGMPVHERGLKPVFNFTPMV
jgi:hypothetical protein